MYIFCPASINHHMYNQLFTPRSLPTGKSATTQLASQFYRPPLVPPSQLAAPCLNSTAQLYSKIQDLKQQRKTSSGQGAKAQHTQAQLSVSREDSKSLNDLEGLQEMVGQKLLKVSVWPVLEGDLILFKWLSVQAYSHTHVQSLDL